MKILTSIFHIFFTILTFAALAIACVLFITTRSKPLFDVRSYTVLSGSMAPSYPVGSIVFVRPSSAYELGDVIAFTRGTQTITHRVVSYKKVGDSREYIVKGDANNAPDSDHVPAKTVIGKVGFSFPLFGRFISAFRSPLGIVLAIGIPALLLILHEVWVIKQEFEVIIEKKVRKKLEKEVKETIKWHLSMHNVHI